MKPSSLLTFALLVGLFQCRVERDWLLVVVSRLIGELFWQFVIQLLGVVGYRAKTQLHG